jgi:hypothetical protein
MKSKFDTLVEKLMSYHKLQTTTPFLPTRSLSDLKSHREVLKQNYMRMKEGAKKEATKAKLQKINAQIAKLENPTKRTLTPFDTGAGF